MKIDEIKLSPKQTKSSNEKNTYNKNNNNVYF